MLRIRTLHAATSGLCLLFGTALAATPDAEQIRAAADCGAGVIEIHTGAYADASGEALAGEVLVGVLMDRSSEVYVCSSYTFEILLRMRRSEAASFFEPVPLKWLSAYLARQHELGSPGRADAENLERHLDRLTGYEAPASHWETEILTARLSDYTTSLMDRLFNEYSLRWFGQEKEKICLGYLEDRELYVQKDSVAKVVLSNTSSQEKIV